MSQDKNILVVDDEKNIRMTMVHALETCGFHVELAITGEEALLMLKASPFDLLFLDLKMPGMDGLEVLRKARVGEASAVIVTTRDDNTNMMVAQVAKQILGVRQAVARVFDPAREAIYHGLDIETVCPTTLAADVAVERLSVSLAATALVAG